VIGYKLENPEKIMDKMSELITPIHQQIMMCDNRNELLMLASCLMVATKDIFDQEIGIEGRKKMFKDFT